MSFENGSTRFMLKGMEKIEELAILAALVTVVQQYKLFQVLANYAGGYTVKIDLYLVICTHKDYLPKLLEDVAGIEKN